MPAPGAPRHDPRPISLNQVAAHVDALASDVRELRRIVGWTVRFVGLIVAALIVLVGYAFSNWPAFLGWLGVS